jgi:hypothetical protein
MTMEMKLKQNIPQVKVPRLIQMIPIYIVDPRILAMFNEPNIRQSTVYYDDNDKSKTTIWHGNYDGTWDCVVVTH